MRKQRTRLLVGTVVSLLLLAWVIRQTEWNVVAQRLREADPLLLLLAALAVALNLVVRAWRWRIMLEPEDSESSFLAIFDIVNVGYLANNILPARLGDLLRAYLAGEWSHSSRSFALSTTVVERVLDTLVVVIMLFGALPFLPVPPVAARTGALLGVLFFMAALLLAVAAWQRAWSERLLRVLLRPLPLDGEMWGARLVSLLDGFSLVQQPRRLVRVLVVTAILWLDAIAVYWLTFRAFELSFMGMVNSAFVLCMAALGMAAPSGPASAGTFDAAAAWGLVILGVPEGLAGGIAVVLHVINFVVVTLLGLWSMGRRGLSLAGLSRRAGEVEQMNVGTVE